MWIRLPDKDIAIAKDLRELFKDSLMVDLRSCTMKIKLKFLLRSFKYSPKLYNGLIRMRNIIHDNRRQ